MSPNITIILHALVSDAWWRLKITSFSSSTTVSEVPITFLQLAEPAVWHFLKPQPFDSVLPLVWSPSLSTTYKHSDVIMSPKPTMMPPRPTMMSSCHQNPQWCHQDPQWCHHVTKTHNGVTKTHNDVIMSPKSTMMSPRPTMMSSCHQNPEWCHGVTKTHSRPSGCSSWAGVWGSPCKHMQAEVPSFSAPCKHNSAWCHLKPLSSFTLQFLTCGPCGAFALSTLPDVS